MIPPTIQVPIQVTHDDVNHILTNAHCWSADGQWLVYDVRSDREGALFDGHRIERVHVDTGRVEVLYESLDGVGVVTCHPVDERMVFIHGPESRDDDWRYSATHRHGFMVYATRPRTGQIIDARDLVPPYTLGALRGGTHLHTFSGDGVWIASTYQDDVLERLDRCHGAPPHDPDQRVVAVSVPEIGPVAVSSDHPRNQNGTHFSVIVTQTHANPRPGSDEISRACEEAWVGVDGYVRSDGTRQRRAVAFQGRVVSSSGSEFDEAFLVDLPESPTGWLSEENRDHLVGTETKRPGVPIDVGQRRLTFTQADPYPGLSGPRHWLRSSPLGDQVAMLRRDESGVVQIFCVSPLGGSLRQITHNAVNVASAFTWSNDGQWITYVMDGSVCVTHFDTRQTFRITAPVHEEMPPSGLACVFSPDGSRIAFMRPVPMRDGAVLNQIFVVELCSKPDVVVTIGS